MNDSIRTSILFNTEKNDVFIKIKEGFNKKITITEIAMQLQFDNDCSIKLDFINKIDYEFNTVGCSKNQISLHEKQ